MFDDAKLTPLLTAQAPLAGNNCCMDASLLHGLPFKTLIPMGQFCCLLLRDWLIEPSHLVQQFCYDIWQL